MSDYKLSNYSGGDPLKQWISHHIQSVPGRMMVDTTEVIDDPEEDHVTVHWQGVMRMSREEYESLVNQPRAGDPLSEDDLQRCDACGELAVEDDSLYCPTCEQHAQDRSEIERSIR